MLSKLSHLMVLVIITIVACDKPEPYELSPAKIYEPLPYLPIYPGSYWDYIDTSMATKRFLTKPNYVPIKIEYTDSITLDPILLPVYNDNYYLGYNQLTYSENWYEPHVVWKLIFSDELNKKFSSSESGIIQKTYYSIRKNYEVVAVDKSMNHPYLGLIDSIVIIDQKTIYDYVGLDYTTHGIAYFAKNIGIIRNCSINDASGDTTVILDLKSYFINH